MRLPRWTVYPALAVLATFLVTAVPRPVDPHALGLGAADGASRLLPVSRHPRVVVLGIDGLDPKLLEQAMERFSEGMANFRRLAAKADGVQVLRTSCPPQSPVAWSNFITGRNPGGHGVFDFIHRDPMTRAPIPGTTKEEKGSTWNLWGDWKLPLGGEVGSNRSGEAFWQTLARHGVRADVWRMPANFPVEPADGLSFPDMLTPAMDSAYGVYKIYTTNPPLELSRSGGHFIPLRPFEGVVDTYLEGPPNSFKQGDPQVRIPLRILIDPEHDAVAVEVGGSVLVLEPGEWSDFVRVSFDLLPMSLAGAGGTVRFYLRGVRPELELYASPVNIDPLAPAMPVSAPERASADLAKAIGLYYTQGMAEEVNALKDGAFDEREFMEQARLVYEERVRMMHYALDNYLADDRGGLLFFYYSTVDLCMHMMWCVADEAHPQHARVGELARSDSSRWSGRPGSTWRDVIWDLYMQMDPILGTVLDRLGDDALVIVMSDHGFAPYYRKFSLNTWLLEQGYLVLEPRFQPTVPLGDPSWPGVEGVGSLNVMAHVDWSKTRAYGMGFNGLYLNLAGRERDDPTTPEDESGIVRPGAEAQALIAELKQRLEAFEDPYMPGRRVVRVADVASQVYSGERLAEAPDILVGYDSGYGNADSASIGLIPPYLVESNLGGSFNGNHLMAPEVVPGVLLTNAPVAEGSHGLEDLTAEILRRYGVPPAPGTVGRPVLR